ncbi:MAG TPA: secretin N-terminal domain-containing protein [Candidatus Omnitrophota bacterium]|nr:secretin N-terminal domain-containing protein [Candidatus Omnitrophota bacterium]
MRKSSLALALLTAGVCLGLAANPVFAADPASPAPKSAVPDAASAPASVDTVTIVKTAPSPQDDTISLDFKDADIGSVLRVLSMKSNVNIVTGPEVKGLVTVRLDNVPWEKALDVILRTYDYVYERDGNIIRVTTRDKMKLEPVETKTFILNYSKAAEIQTAVQDILTERGRIKVAERTNMVVVTDIPTNLYRIGEVIKKLDKETSQAFIDSRVVRTEAGLAENLGIDWNVEGGITSGASRPTTFPFSAVRDKGSAFPFKDFFPTQSGATLTVPASAPNPSDPRSFPNIQPGAGFAWGTLDFSSFSAVLQMLKSYSDTKIVSNPRVVVLNNQTALIQVGQQIPLASFERNETTGSMEVTGFTYRDVGVVLNVTPHINSADEILVDLKPEVSSMGDMIDFTATLAAPSFNVTQAETQVLIKSGQTIAIGGLLSDSATQSEDKVPYLADIPLVGKLFRSKRQEPTGNAKIETLFFVTVTTVDSQGQPVGSKVDEESSQSQKDQAKPKTAVTDAGQGLKDPEKQAAPETSDKDKTT